MTHTHTQRHTHTHRDTHTHTQRHTHTHTQRHTHKYTHRELLLPQLLPSEDGGNTEELHGLSKKVTEGEEEHEEWLNERGGDEK